MPGDPKECRRHALACVRLAQTSSTPQTREQFANLARTWIRLADDLERTLGILNAEDDDTEPECRVHKEEAPSGGAFGASRRS